MDNTSDTQTRPRLRPGWRIPLTIAGMFGFVGLGIGASVLLTLLGVPQPVAQIVGPVAMSAGAIGIAYCLRRYIDRRPWRDLGLTWRATDLLRLLGGGVLAAIVVVTIKAITVAIGLSEWSFGYEEELPLAVSLAIGYLMIILGQAFPEELLWRGYLFASLSAEWRRWAVIVATSVGFGALHVISNPGNTAGMGWRLLYAVMACGLGFALAACRVRSRSIWLAVGFHAGHNLVGGMLGTGAYGWSLLVSFAVFCGFGAVMLWTSPKRPEPGVVEMPTHTAMERLQPVNSRGSVVRRWGFFLSVAAVAMSTVVTGTAAAAEPGCRDGIADELLSGSCESEADDREPEVEGVDSLKKSADHKSYEPGDKITFTIEISASDSGTSTDNFDVFDKMDDVLDDAAYNDDAEATTGAAELSQIDGSRILRWRGQLDPGASATLTFSVTANAKGDKQIRNFALHAAHNGSECGFSRSHGPPPGDTDFDDVPPECKVTVPPGEDKPGDDDDNGDDDSSAKPVADNGSTLPITGASLGTLIAVAAALVLVGAVLLLVARKRRSQTAQAE